MFDHNHYVPILKGKAGEYGALQAVAPIAKSRMTPLIEVPRIPWDYVNECEQKTIDSHVEKVGEKIQAAWASDEPLFIDLPFLSPDETLGDGQHPLTFIFEDARTRSLHAIPVTGLRRSSDYQTAARDIAALDGSGVCLRLDGDDFEEMSALAAQIHDFLSLLSLSTSQVDLIVDLKDILPGHVNPLVLGVQAMLTNLPHVSEWRTLTVAGTAFPENLSGFPSAAVSRIQRAEWVIWQTLLGRRQMMVRVPAFGDYGIQHPDPPELDPRIMQMSANLRYTADSEWVVFKGRSIKTHGARQFNDLCRMLVDNGDYGGRNHCWGDAYVERCAANSDGPGNATIWRRIGTSHHLTLVTEQLASLSAP